ncbi:MAG TPA: SlyX family protein [Nitrospirae bacterium]|nr:SlyX family protein [Nitrospirota bacterium]
MNEDRLVDIEGKIAFQENIIKELNDVVCRQQKQIDTLNLTCRQLVDQIKKMSGISSGGDLIDDKPPHY